jgi:UDP-N-acetylglucosamine 2-epimerase (non-hydrolysing)
VVAGARPNFMKVAPIIRELDRRSIPRVFVHTGQHYDVRMSGALLEELGVPNPDILLEVGSASHAVQTARIMERFEPVLLAGKPSWVVVVGDVNSTLACALVAAKLREETGCRIAHVEAGLRSRDWAMPEEVNRVLTDRLADVLLTPSEEVHQNLAQEGIAPERVRFVGNVMIDSLLEVLPRARALAMHKRFGVPPGSFVLATLHRPSNVDDPDRLALILTALKEAARERPVVFPIHPRTKERAQSGDLSSLLQGLTVIEPLGYAEMVGAMDGACAVLTDSGGVQEETTVLGVPCVTVRAQTERPVTVTHGTNRMIAWPPSVEGIVSELNAGIRRGRAQVGSLAPTGWDGHAATRIVDAICGDLG